MENIRLKHKMIQMEALQNGLPVTLGSPTFIKVKGIAKAIAQWSKEKIRPELRVLPVVYNRISSPLSRANYTDLQGVRVSIPRGLKGYMNAYVEGVFEVFLKIENVQAEVLTPFNTWLTLRLAAPASMSNINGIADLKGYKETDISKAQSILSGYVDPNSRRESAPMGEVLPSISVTKTTWDNINALTTRYLETNPTAILKQVNDIAVKIDRLIKVIEELPEKEAKMSGQQATILSGICAQMAEAIDLYGQVGILVRELAVVGTRQVEELKGPVEASSKKVSKFAMESLDFGGGMMLTFDGASVDYNTLMDVISCSKYAQREALPIEHFKWLAEEGIAIASADGVDRWTETFVIKQDDCYYPVSNINAVAAALAAGHQSVQCVIIGYNDLVQELNT